MVTFKHQVLSSINKYGNGKYHNVVMATGSKVTEDRGDNSVSPEGIYEPI